MLFPMFFIYKYNIKIYINIHIINTMKFHNIEKDILKFIKESKVITSSELAKFLKISWNTADKHLLELTLDNKIQRIKKKGVNLWTTK